MRASLSVVTLGVGDFRRALRFYKKGLGWPTFFEQDDIAFFKLGGVVLAIHPREALAKDATVSAEGGGFSGVTLAHNVASEREADEALRDAERAGGRIVKKAQQVFWGGYSGYFADPDGHLWEVVYNPHWTLDAHGGVIRVESEANGTRVTFELPSVP